MVKLENGDRLRVSAAAYQLEFPSDRPFVYLNSPAGERLVELFVASSVHPLHDRDDTLRLEPWQVAETAEGVTLTCRVHSSVWAEKTIRLRCFALRLEYDVVVEGSGKLAEVLYFGGYYSGQSRWGSGFFRSGQRFRRGFNPEPTTDETYHFAPAEGATIDLTGVPLPGKSDWFFTPPPFCYTFETAAGWLGLGVQAEPGENQFTEYGYHGGPGSFYLSLQYEGHTPVEGSYRLPTIGFDFAAEEYAALSAHLGVYWAAASLRASAPAAWWQEPIFCGWGAQCHLAARDGGRAPEKATQTNYETFLGALDAHDLNPGIVVLDDKWQATYGDNAADRAKWPDLPGFVRQQHDRGRRVLLWLKAWDFEGVPVEACITNAAGARVALDPTHPRYRQRLVDSIERMLGAQGYDADGFKLDFTARIPSGPGLRAHGRAWGLELMRAYLDLLYSTAKAVKPDALVMTHTPHPYLAGALDMIRLNDVNTAQPVLPAMRHRAQVARLACPQALIDTDNWPMPDRAAWREYVARQPELGVPSLYFATHIDSTGEVLAAEDYALLRETWARHRANVRAQRRA